MGFLLKCFRRLNQIHSQKNYEDAFFLHLEQQKPIVSFLRTGFAERGQVLLFGFAFLMNLLTLAVAFFKQLPQHTP